MPSLFDTDPEEARSRLEEIRRLTRGALAEMRALLVELRPGALTELPLADLVRQLAEAASGRSRLEVAVGVSGQPSAKLPADVQVAMYRVAQEALSSVMKHAAAQKVQLDLAFLPSGGVTLLVEDDGRGFDTASIPPGHLGVGIMRERADAIGAWLEVDSAPQAGTRLMARWEPRRAE